MRVNPFFSGNSDIFRLKRKKHTLKPKCLDFIIENNCRRYFEIFFQIF